ncbi:MAG: tRNA 2-selenouridine(34) synthase MnmH [Syntrophotaleaceae bacterium]
MFPRFLNPEEFLQQAAESPVFDVRTPGEFCQAHIPGACNLPLFSNEERHEIGILYKESGRQAAILRGLEIVGPRLAEYVLLARAVASNENILLHCWRGGMRSESLAWLLDKAGFRVGVLKGGYKAFRRLVIATFAQPLRLLVVGGMTGSGKTEILKRLGDRGEQVLDLEGLAQHRGSAFGAVGNGEQPSSEQVENEVFAVLRTFDPSRTIWVEDESRRIGRVLVNELLFRQMRGATVIRIHVPREIRVERLCREYGREPRARLAAAVGNIGKRLGGENAARVLQAIEEGDYRQAAQTILEYYDKTYLYGISKRDPATIIDLDPTPADPAAIADALIVRAESLGG